MKGETYKSNPWFFMAAGNYLIVGLIAEDGQKTIYVARQYYEIKPERKTDTVPSRKSAWHCMSSHSPQERWW